MLAILGKLEESERIGIRMGHGEVGPDDGHGSY